MSSSELQRFIWDVVPQSFDFMYLRFDFSSSANVGYGAFALALATLVLTDNFGGNSFCQLYRRARFIVVCQDQVGRQVEYVLE